MSVARRAFLIGGAGVLVAGGGLGVSALVERGSAPPPPTTSTTRGPRSRATITGRVEHLRGTIRSAVSFPSLEASPSPDRPGRIVFVDVEIEGAPVTVAWDGTTPLGLVPAGGKSGASIEATGVLEATPERSLVFVGTRDLRFGRGAVEASGLSSSRLGLRERAAVLTIGPSSRVEVSGTVAVAGIGAEIVDVIGPLEIAGDLVVDDGASALPVPASVVRAPEGRTRIRIRRDGESVVEVESPVEGTIETE